MTELTYVPGRPERNGWIMGLTMPQAIVCLVAVLPLILFFGANRPAQGLVLLPFSAVVVALTVIPIRGRPAVKWLADTVLFLAEGRLVAHGTHAELLASTPGYAALVEAYEHDRADPTRSARASVPTGPANAREPIMDEPL